MRVLFLDSQGLFLDMVLRAMEDGHRCKWYIPQSAKTENIGRGLADIIPEWQPWMKWADLVILADNTRHLKGLEPFRKDGPLIIGATEESASWELDREKGQDVFAEAGIDVPDYKEFSKYDDAITYVKKEMRRFVSKPCGDEPDKSLTYCAKSPEDLVFMLERWKKLQKIKSRFLLQEFIPGIEMAVGAWIGPHGFNALWCENFEEKRLMAGDKGPACFTPDAEVLTYDGWKFWPDITAEDEICILKDGKIVYEKPSQVVVADFDGELIGWQSPTVDILVTPGHNMYVQDDHYRKPFWFEPAEVSFENRRTIMRGGGEWYGDSDYKPPVARTDLASWAALLGAHIADGYCRRRSVVFGNCPPHKVEAFSKIAQAAGYEAHLYNKELYINSIELSQYLREFGLALDKHVPQYIKDASPDVIEAFLYGYGVGDGSRRPNNMIYTTISRRLADDLQELLLKVGRVGNINMRDRRGESHMVAGIACVNRHIAYDVSVAAQKLKAELSPDNSYQETYRGKVYCVTVSSHVIYTRRNGKTCWIGQTGEMGTVVQYVKASKLARKVLAPLEDQLVDSGHTGYVDVNCIIDEHGDPWPLEWTMRFGWPTQQIQQPLHNGDTIQWLADLAEGRDARQARPHEISLGVVMAIPSFPYSLKPVAEVTGIPVYGMADDSLHPCEMMQAPCPQEVNGKIVTAPCMATAGDYVLVATGVAETIRDARAKALRQLEKLSAPCSPFWRPDIGARLRKQLPELQKHGFAENLGY